ncbi:TonB-dependent siderophore receptor [Leptothoe sp. LEGE 181152]|nr:TonB-dependent siderophore receptor [Leptothoe sp. LEGE 181152]
MAKRLWGISLTGVVFLIMYPALAEGQTIQGRPNISVNRFAQTNPIEITNVLIDETATGLTLQLTTNGDLATPETSTSSNAMVIDIPNAVLQLSEGDEFLVSNPTDGIVLVNVINLPDNRVQIVITGADAAPTLEVTTAAANLTVSVTPGDATAQAPDDDSLRIVVTGEGDDGDYFVPDASTATRTNTSLLDTSASIQVIPRQVLEDQQVIRLEEALTNVSGVTTSNSFGNAGENFNIRGFNDATVLLDGFRQFGGFGQSLSETTNLERVEVLKGPASILYGEIQPGGVINLVTEQPLSEPLYDIQLQVGNREFFRPQLDFTGPLTADGRLLYRLNASYRSEDSFRDFDQEFERFFVSPVLSWQISDRTDLTVQFEYVDEESPLDNGLLAIGNDVADIPFDRSLDEPDNVVNNEFVNVGYRFEHRFSDNWRLRNAFRYTDRDLLNIGAIPFDFDETTGLQTRFAGQQAIDTQNYSLQTNVVGEFATGSVEHTLLFGVDLNRTGDQEVTSLDFFNPQIIDIFDPVFGAFDNIDFDDLPLARNSESQTDRLGIYLQDQIDLTDELIVVAGLRYDTVERNDTNGITVFDPVESETTQNDDAVTPRVGIVYQPASNISLYGSYSQSFTPSFDTTTTGNPLDPEQGEGFEFGAKAELLDGNLLATLAYFDITRQNVATPDPIDSLSSVATGEQRSRGIELDVTGEILPGWNVIASYAYIDAEVTEDNFIPEGNRTFNTPENSASLWTTYEVQEGDLEGLGVGLGFNFVDQRAGDLDNSFELDSYFITNAALSYRRDNWRAALNFRNLFDVDYILAAANSRIFGVEPGDPFTVTASFSVEF